MFCNPPIAASSCEAAHAAFTDGTLIPDGRLRAWVLVDAPRRRCATEMRIAQTNTHDDEPYQWMCCPYCGGDLPAVIGQLPSGSGDTYR